MKDKGANEGEKVLVFPASIFCKWANKKSPSQYNTTYELSTFSCSKSLMSTFALLTMQNNRRTRKYQASLPLHQASLPLHQRNLLYYITCTINIQTIDYLSFVVHKLLLYYVENPVITFKHLNIKFSYTIEILCISQLFQPRFQSF